MTIFDYLASPIGIDVQHAVIVLILAVAAYISYLAKRQSTANSKLLNAHLTEHINAALEERPVGTLTPEEPPLGSDT